MDSFMAAPDDGCGDDRVTCRSCRNFIPWRRQCREPAIDRFGEVMPDLARYCLLYLPTPKETDQRTGRDRWPGLAEQMAELHREHELRVEAMRR